jgi:TonB family protein
MIHVVATALLALSLNQYPNLPSQAGSKAKAPPRTEKPKPPPPKEPSQDKPMPAPSDDEAPRPHKPDRDEDAQSQVPQYREEPYLAVIRRNMPHVESCFARARAWSPALQGEVVVEWEISPGGTVYKAQVTGNSTGSADLADCILQAVKTWTFREPNATYPTHVRHPFRFQSS